MMSAMDMRMKDISANTCWKRSMKFKPESAEVYRNHVLIGGDENIKFEC
jgi:hypothetical protein